MTVLEMYSKIVAPDSKYRMHSFLVGANDLLYILKEEPGTLSQIKQEIEIKAGIKDTLNYTPINNIVDSEDYSINLLDTYLFGLEEDDLDSKPKLESNKRLIPQIFNIIEKVMNYYIPSLKISKDNDSIEFEFDSEELDRIYFSFFNYIELKKITGTYHMDDLDTFNILYTLLSDFSRTEYWLDDSFQEMHLSGYIYKISDINKTHLEEGFHTNGRPLKIILNKTGEDIEKNYRNKFLINEISIDTIYRYLKNLLKRFTSLAYAYSYCLDLSDKISDYIEDRKNVAVQEFDEQLHNILKSTTETILMNNSIMKFQIYIEENPNDYIFSDKTLKNAFLVEKQKVYLYKRDNDSFDYFVSLPAFHEESLAEGSFVGVTFIKQTLDSDGKVGISYNNYDYSFPYYFPENSLEILKEYPKLRKAIENYEALIESEDFDDSINSTLEYLTSKLFKQYSYEAFDPIVFGRQANGRVIKINYGSASSIDELTYSHMRTHVLGTSYKLKEEVEILSIDEIIDIIINKTEHENGTMTMIKQVMHLSQLIHNKLIETKLETFNSENYSEFYAYKIYNYILFVKENKVFIIKKLDNNTELYNIRYLRQISRDITQITSRGTEIKVISDLDSEEITYKKMHV